MDTESLFADLVSFIRDQIGEYHMPMHRNTGIEDDLGVSGIDAEELILAFSKRYNVCIDNFLFSRYFSDEPGVFNFRNKRVQPFFIRYFENAIHAGRLDEEVINAIIIAILMERI